MGNISTNGTITAKSFLGNATSATRLKNSSSSRPTTLDLVADGSGDVITFKATSSLTSGAGAGDGHILHFYWDNKYNWDSQLLIPNGGTRPIQFRHQDGSSWMDWVTVIDSNNYTSYALPRVGGTLSGRLSIKDSRIDLKSTDNGISSTTKAKDFEFRDKNDLLSFWMQPIYYSSGEIGITASIRNYDTNGTKVARGDITFTAEKSGLTSLQISTNLVLTSSIYGTSLPTSNLISGRIFYVLT